MLIMRTAAAEWTGLPARHDRRIDAVLGKGALR
jgi:hypothetical protein